MRASLATLTTAAMTLALGLAPSTPSLAQAVIAPAAMPLAAVEAGPGWQPRSARPLGLDTIRGARPDPSASSGNAAQPERFTPQSSSISGGSPVY